MHAGDQRGRHGNTNVMLGHEGFQHLNLDSPLRLTILFDRLQGMGIFHMRRKISAIPQMPSAPDHGQVDASAAPLHPHGQNIHIGVGPRVHRLLVQDLGQGRHLVTHLGGQLKLQPLGVLHHPGFHLLQQRLGLAAQKSLGMLHVVGIGLRADQIDARARAALDLIKQTGPGPVGKHRVFTSAQTEHFLQQLDGLFDRPSARKGSEIAVFLFYRTPVISHPGEGLWLRRSADSL